MIFLIIKDENDWGGWLFFVPVVAVVAYGLLYDKTFLLGLAQIYADFMFTDIAMLFQEINIVYIVMLLYQRQRVPLECIAMLGISVLVVVAVCIIPLEINMGHFTEFSYVLVREIYSRIF